MKKLKYYGGSGFDGVRELGLFKVKYRDKSVEFKTLTIAKDFYDSLNCEKALFSVDPTELLICHTY